MFNEFMKSIGLILPVTIVTMGLEAFIIARTPKAANPSMMGTLFGFMIFGLGFGLLAIFVYHQVGNRWPETAAQTYLWIALGSAVVLTLLALIMPFAFKMPWRNAVIWTVENFIWAVSYGWFLPQILSVLPKSI